MFWVGVCNRLAPGNPGRARRARLFCSIIRRALYALLGLEDKNPRQDKSERGAVSKL